MTLRFGTDGVRGVANQELTAELVTALGRRGAGAGADQPFVIGRPRRSGPMLEAALVAGHLRRRRQCRARRCVTHAGVAFLARERGAPGAVISASHNPVRRQRHQAARAGGRKFTEPVEMQVEARARASSPSDRSPTPARRGRGVGVSSEHRNALDDYVAYLVGAVGTRPLDGLRVVLDCGNGAAFRAAPTAPRSLGAVDVLNASPDGVNINAGCGSTDIRATLRDAVVAVRANAGLAFDGDADRVIAVDERGEVVDGDQILAIAALDLHEGSSRGARSSWPRSCRTSACAARSSPTAIQLPSRRRSATATCSTRWSSATSRSVASSPAT